MSRKDAREFVRNLFEDESLREEVDEELNFGETDQRDEKREELRAELARIVPDVADEHGYDFTAEEGFEALQEVRESLDDQELSDVELERVSGGDPKNKAEFWTISFAGIGAGCAGYSLAEPGSKKMSCKFE